MLRYFQFWLLNGWEEPGNAGIVVDKQGFKTALQMCYRNCRGSYKRRNDSNIPRSYEALKLGLAVTKSSRSCRPRLVY